MFGLGMGELVVLLIVILLLFGGKKFPQLGSAMGKALTNFKQGLKEGKQKEEEDNDNQNNSLIKTIGILAEMTRSDIERSSVYFDTNLKLEMQRQ